MHRERLRNWVRRAEVDDGRRAGVTTDEHARMTELGRELEPLKLTTTAAPDLAAAFGIGPDIGPEMLVTAGDDTDRIRSNAALAKAVRRVPDPSRIWHDQRTSPAHPRWEPASQRRPLPGDRRPDALAPSHDRVRRTTPPTSALGDHPLPQELPGPRDLPPASRSELSRASRVSRARGR